MPNLSRQRSPKGEAMNKSPKEVAEIISRFVNGASSQDIEALALEIRRDHRTLQQTTFKLVATLIEQWAKDETDGNFDARNESTVQTCRKLVDDNPDLGCVPLI